MSSADDIQDGDDIEESAAPLIEHLAELRNRLIHSAIAFVIGMVICFTVWNPIFNFLTDPLRSAMADRGQADCGLILIKLQEGFFVAISNFVVWRPDPFVSVYQLSAVAVRGPGPLSHGKECVFAVLAGLAADVPVGGCVCVLRGHAAGV